ncbi:hypothetical protein D3C86_1949200 [compost metagenome]
MVHIGRARRIGEGLIGHQQVVRVLLEEERRFAIRVVTHLDGVGRIVAAHAIDPAHRKTHEATGDRQQDGW